MGEDTPPEDPHPHHPSCRSPCQARPMSVQTCCCWNGCCSVVVVGDLNADFSCSSHPPHHANFVPPTAPTARDNRYCQRHRSAASSNICISSMAYCTLQYTCTAAH